MTKENKNQIEKTIARFKENVDKNGVPIKHDILSLQGYKDFMSQEMFQSLIDEMRLEKLIKGERGGGNDSKHMKEIRNRWNKFLQSLVKDGLTIKDDEYYQATKRERYVVLNSNDDRVLPSLNLSNIDEKERKKQEKERLEAKILNK